MTTSLSGDIFLVGSIPFENTEAVFKTSSELFGDRLFALPDGELGARSHWIMGLPHMAYVNHPDLEPIHVVSQDRVISPDGHAPDQMRATRATFRVKPGVTETRFDLPYGNEAVASYEIFRRLKESGAIPAHMRFQVCFPTTQAATTGFFPDKKDRPIVWAAYNRGMRNGIDRILAHVPARELVIQLDYCTELMDILGARDHYLGKQEMTPDERFELYTSAVYLNPMSEMIPADVAVGYHLCYGTWGGWPVGEVKDIGFCVKLANALVKNTSRRIDYVHLPAMPGANEAFFKPLTELDIGEAKVFLGIELADGPEAMSQRAAAARKYLLKFGVSHYCGYGRGDKQRVLNLMHDLLDGAQRQ